MFKDLLQGKALSDAALTLSPFISFQESTDSKRAQNVGSVRDSMQALCAASRMYTELPAVRKHAIQPQMTKSNNTSLVDASIIAS